MYRVRAVVYSHARMHRQIKIVAIMLIVQGGMEVAMGLFLCVMGPVMFGLMNSAGPMTQRKRPMATSMPPWTMSMMATILI